MTPGCRGAPRLVPWKNPCPFPGEGRWQFAGAQGEKCGRCRGGKGLCGYRARPRRKSPARMLPADGPFEQALGHGVPGTATRHGTPQVLSGKTGFDQRPGGRSDVASQVRNGTARADIPDKIPIFADLAPWSSERFAAHAPFRSRKTVRMSQTDEPDGRARRTRRRAGDRGAADGHAPAVAASRSARMCQEDVPR